MGIRRGATVKEAVLSDRRRRRNRLEMLNDIEADLTVLKEQICDSMEDTIVCGEENQVSNQISRLMRLG